MAEDTLPATAKTAIENAGLPAHQRLLTTLEAPNFMLMSAMARVRIQWAIDEDGYVRDSAGVVRIPDDSMEEMHAEVSHDRVLSRQQETFVGEAERFQIELVVAQLLAAECAPVLFERLTLEEFTLVKTIRGAQWDGGEDLLADVIDLPPGLFFPHFNFVLWWNRTGGRVPAWFRGTQGHIRGQ